MAQKQPRVTRNTEKIIDHDAAIRKDLARGLINVRALARFVQLLLGPSASLDAIISAIHRYRGFLREELKEESRVNALLGRTRLNLRNKVVDITLTNEARVQAKLAELVRLIDFAKGEILRVVQGVESIKLIVDEKNLEKVLESFNKAEVISILRDLSEIIASFPKEAEKTPGIVAKIATELSLNDINLTEILSCAPELILVVSEKEGLRAYQVIQDIAAESMPQIKSSKHTQGTLK